MRLELYKALQKPYTSKYGGLVQNIILVNVLLNIFVSFCADLFEFSIKIEDILAFVEYITVAVFVVELSARYFSIGCNPQYRGLRGKLAFTFTPFIIIDIIALVPYFFLSIPGDVLLPRILRFLKLIRLRHTIKSLFSISAFASSSILAQIIVLFMASIFFIILFSYFYSGEKTSLLIFLDPAALAETATNYEMFFGVLELVIGLFVGGALISIITELIANVSSDIKSGYYPSKAKEHIIIINHNTKLEYILKQISHYYNIVEQMQEIVIFLPLVDDIEAFRQNLQKFTNLNISLLTGEELNWNSYKKLNINYAKKVLILQDSSLESQHLNTNITKYILSNEKFYNPNLEFIIETKSDKILSAVYKQIFKGLENRYSIIDHNLVIQKFLNRSIIEPIYFKIYSKLLSYKDNELYVLSAKEIFDEKIAFTDAYMQFNLGVIIGVVKDNELYLNPSNDMIIEHQDKLIVILKDRYDYSLDKTFNKQTPHIKLNQPRLKNQRKVCIVGDYDKLNFKEFEQFLTKDSLYNMKQFILEDNDYTNLEFWDKIIKQSYDIIIFNMEDDYEFLLTMYLRNSYEDNKEFLNSIVNIIHIPTNAKLLTDKSLNRNVILSEEFVGQYATQVMFNQSIIDIFREVTQAKGNEFYILNQDEYGEIFKLEYKELKQTLLANSMLYIGSIVDDEFMINHKDIKQAQKLIVLSDGTS